MGQEKDIVKIFLKIFAMVSMILVFFMAHVWVRTRAVTLGYELQTKRNELHQLEEKSFSIQLKQHQEANWERLDEENHLQGWGLKKPLSSQLIFLENEKH
jgi:hypothetical protein